MLDFKAKLIDIQKWISNIRARSTTKIKDDLSNINKLDDLIVQLSSECEDVMWKIISLKMETEGSYYDVLNKIACDYSENELPIFVKSNSDYKKYSKRLYLLENLLEEVKRTQDVINNRRYGLTNAIKVKQFLDEVVLGH